MKKFALLIIVSMILPLISPAQDTISPRKHEIGLTFSSLNSFGVNYKTGRKSMMFRASLLAINVYSDNAYGRSSDSIDRKNSGYGCSLRAGFEKRIRIVENLNFMVGLDGGISYRNSFQKYDGAIYNSSQEHKTWTISPTVACVLGVSYTIREVLVISAEVDPTLSFTYGKETYTTSTRSTELTLQDVHFGFSNGSAGLTIAYRFGK